MSLTESRTPAGALPACRTAQTLLQKKRSGQPITAITASDYPTARLIDEAGIDMILVGDSLAMATLGQTNTLSVSMDEMLHHARAVARGAQTAFLVGDMPYGSYQVSEEEAVRNALRFIREAGMAAVKLEGAHPRLTARLTDAEIQVVGHLGLTPQSVHRMGGYKVQARTLGAMETLLEDALELEHAGAVALVLEGIPREVAERITRHVEIPTIGIGAGPGCDGQILVFHDAFHLTFAPSAKFVRRFGDAAALFREGLEEFRDSVANRSFPSDAESYHLPAEVAATLEPLVKV